MDIKTKLSTLWMVVMLNMIFADIYSIFVLLGTESKPDIPGDVEMVMAVVALITNIPIMMVFLSRSLSYKANRIANIIAGIFTIIYIIGGSSATPHYIVVATIEIVLLLVIIWSAWRWKAD